METTHAKRRDRGAAMVEFSMVIPVFLVLIIAVYTVGNSIAQMTWVINTTYTAAIAGASSPNTASVSRRNAILERAAFVANIIDGDSKKLKQRIYSGEFNAVNPDNPSSVRTVLAGVSGEIGAMKGLLTLDNRVLTELTAPVLVADTPEGLATDFFEQWGNAIVDDASGSKAFRGCEGEQLDSPMETNCIGVADSLF